MEVRVPPIRDDCRQVERCLGDGFQVVHMARVRVVVRIPGHGGCGYRLGVRLGLFKLAYLMNQNTA